MKNKSQNLVVLFINRVISKKEEDCLNAMLLHLESPEQFCIAHELVNRNRITNTGKKLLQESRRRQLKPFHFLINKN